MNIQRHRRIARIKQLSAAIHALLGIGLLVLGVLALLAPLAPFHDGTIRLYPEAADIRFRMEELGWTARIVGVLVVEAILLFAIRLVLELRKLMKQFNRGLVFSAEATQAARNALFNGLILFGIQLTGQMLAVVYQMTGNTGFHIQLDFTQLCYAFLFFGLMYVLLWTLEIGHDLHDESALTV